MAKFIKTYENDTIKETLVFRGQEFSNTMGPWENGERHGDKCFEDQLREAFKDDPDIEDIAVAAGELDFGDDDEIEDALRIMDDHEN